MNNVNAEKTNYTGRFFSLLLIGILLLLFGGNAFAGKVKLAWKASKSQGVGGYKIYYGLSKRNYIASVDVGKKLTYKLKGLLKGETYFLAATAYDKAKTGESRFSNEVKVKIPGVTVSFTPSITTGAAPLIVTFTPNTIGTVRKWKWKFGDNSIPTSKSKIPTVTFSKPGTYTVSLTVIGTKGRRTTKKQQIVVYAPAQGAVQAKAMNSVRIQTKEAVTVPMPGLVAAYGFEENSGNTVKDSSGHGNYGIVKQAIRVKTGRYGKGLKFDGVDDWVTVKDSESLDLTNAFTIEAWVKPDSIRRSSVIAKQHQQGTVYDLYAYEDRDLPFFSFNDGIDYNPVSGQTSLPIRKWSHLAVTFDGTNQNLFINGVLVGAAQSQNRLVQQSNGVLRIGGNSVWGDFFQGCIDEVRIYNYALSAEKIQIDIKTKISAP
jgi:PKD repeat protein